MGNSDSNMKYYLLVLTTLIGCGLADPISVVCSPSEDGLVVFVPHPYECSKFFMCQGLQGVAMFCPGGLQFDTNLNVCNYPEVVGCTNTPYPTEPTSTVEPETTTVEDEEETTLVIEYYDDQDNVLHI